jgi:hypothetical protein
MPYYYSQHPGLVSESQSFPVIILQDRNIAANVKHGSKNWRLL